MLNKEKVGRCKWTCWGSQCGFATEGEEDFCRRHTGRICVVCEAPAVQGCGNYWGPGVCGAPLCEKHTNDCTVHKEG